MQFSMVLPSTAPFLGEADSFVLFGIESHICVLQTALDLLSMDSKPSVYVLADGVSSCNPEEAGIALAVSPARPSLTLPSVHSSALDLVKADIFVSDLCFLQRLRSAGAIVTTSESILFQLQHDAGTPTFRPFTKKVKELKEETKEAMRVLGSLASGASKL